MNRRLGERVPRGVVRGIARTEGTSAQRQEVAPPGISALESWLQELQSLEGRRFHRSGDVDEVVRDDAQTQRLMPKALVAASVQAVTRNNARGGLKHEASGEAVSATDVCIRGSKLD